MANSQEIIAVVDDDPDMRDAMVTLISAYGYGTRTFDTAETFLACASECQARCLLVDIQLGDLSGVELARQLAADGFKFPIIFMSGHDVCSGRGFGPPCLDDHRVAGRRSGTAVDSHQEER